MFFHNLFTILMPKHMSFLYIIISPPLEQTKKYIFTAKIPQNFHKCAA